MGAATAAPVAAVAGAGSGGGRLRECNRERHEAEREASTPGTRERMRRASSPAGANPSEMTESWVRQALDMKRNGGACPAERGNG